MSEQFSAPPPSGMPGGDGPGTGFPAGAETETAQRLGGLVDLRSRR